MTGYHVTTERKIKRYEVTGHIIPPVRFWPDESTARRWMKWTGRDVLLRIEAAESYPMPDHKPARWTPETVKGWVRA